MARSVRRKERRSQPLLKPSKNTSVEADRRTGGHKENASIIKSAMKAPGQGSKLNQTVSAAAIFKTGRVGFKAKKQNKQRSLTPVEPPEFDLARYYKEGVEDARDAIEADQNLKFSNVHNEFLRKLADSRSKDQAFFERISAITAMFNAPLGEERIETTFNREGKRVTEIVQIGERLALFKQSVEKDSTKLKECWRQWEEIQNDFIELGVEVFGPTAFGLTEDNDDNDVGPKQGYRREMELLDLEHVTRVEELTEEVEDLRAKALQKTKASEKELDAIAKREQGRVLSVFMAE